MLRGSPTSIPISSIWSVSPYLSKICSCSRGGIIQDSFQGIDKLPPNSRPYTPKILKTLSTMKRTKTPMKIWISIETILKDLDESERVARIVSSLP
jgi:hypothetical protein